MTDVRLKDPRFQQPLERLSSRRPRFRRLGQTVGGLIALAVLAGVGVIGLNAWTDHEWFASIGQDDVFWIQTWSIAAVWLAFAAITFGTSLIAARLAWRSVGAERRFGRSTAVGAAVLASIMAAGPASSWIVFRLAVADPPFGSVDPLFGLDLGFFVFVLPALELLTSYSFQLISLSAAIYLVVVILSTRLDYAGQVGASWPRLRATILRFTAAILVATAVGVPISVWRLSYSTTQTAFAGASYTDVHAQLPGSIALAVCCLITAVILWRSATRAGLATPVKALAILGAVAVLVNVAVPYVVQRYWATPNEESFERAYLSRNVELTRQAYQLDDVAVESYPSQDADSDTLSQDALDTLSATPVWNASTVAQAFSQLQTIRPYYRLSAISQDRYQVGHSSEQVLIAAREISPSGLAAGANTWVNRRLVYTHGYGVAVASANETTTEGFPHFLLGDIPAVATPAASSLKVSQPRIYFGPDQNDWVLVNTGLDEFDYPSGDTNVTNRYAGGDGVAVGGPLSRLAWSIRLGSPDLLVSSYVNADSRILLNRNVLARASKIAPWLSYDTPYPAVIDGRVTWIIDAYTTTDHFPYSQPLPNTSPFPNGTDYVRSSVKVTVDAETGKTTFYAVGADPVRDAWAQVFGSVISPDPLPAAVADHLRVPMKLFNAQAQVFTKYHVSDPRVFYTAEDRWRIPQDANSNTVAAQYVMLPATGSGQLGLDAVQPYVLPNRDDLVGWLIGSSEPDSYGKTTVYELPKSKVILGAAQAGARINQDPTLAQQLTLWNQPGSTVQFGSMLVLPVGGTTVYVQPIFLRAQRSAITEMVGVVVVDGDRISLGTDLADALAKASATGATTRAQH